MDSAVKRLFCGPSKARKSPVRSTVVARKEKPLPTPPNASAAPVSLPQIQSATRDRCSCGRAYGMGADIHRELRDGHLVAVCGGCA